MHYARYGALVALGLVLGCGQSFTSGAGGGSDAAAGGDGAGGGEAGGGDAGGSETGFGTDANAVPDSPALEGGLPEGSVVTFPCGGTPCSPPAQTCCGTTTNGQTTLTCVNQPSCSAASSFTLHCHSSADCPGSQVCCFQQAQNTAIAACLTAGCGNGLQLCDPTAAAPQCGAGHQCSTNPGGGFDLPPGFAGCGN
jgi:hypothetical protein